MFYSDVHFPFPNLLIFIERNFSLHSYFIGLNNQFHHIIKKVSTPYIMLGCICLGTDPTERICIIHLVGVAVNDVLPAMSPLQTLGTPQGILQRTG